MRILVTGAPGFVGRALVRHLAARGHEVTALARRIPAALPSNVRSLAVDLLDAHATAATLRGESFDAVIHAAAITPAASGNAQQPAAHDDNIPLTSHLLDGLSIPPARFVHLSTLDVYSPPDGDGVLNERSPLGPVSPYAHSKLTSEQLCDAWADRHSIPGVTARLTQVFGPGDPSQKFIPNVTRRIRENLPIELHGDGSDLRDFLYIEDAASLLAALTSQTDATGVFNIASGTSRSLNDVLSVLAGIAHRALPITHLPRKKPLVNYRFDVARLSSAISMTSLTGFTSALRQTLNP